MGATIEPDGWVVTLIGPPEKLEAIGTGDSGWDAYDEHHSGDWEPEGVYVAVPVRLTNKTEENRFLPGTLLRVSDAQGGEFSVVPRLPTVTYIWSTQAWMSDDSLLINNVFDPGDALEGPILFDVPVDAIGLRLAADGSSETIDLGF